MSSVRLILLVALGTLGLAGPAAAATFYVDDNGAGPPTPGCQDVSYPCSTINAALTASRALAGTGDTIDVAGGTYAEDLAVDQPQDDGLTIAGPASGGLLGGAKLQLASPAGQAIKLGAPSPPLNSNLTLSNIQVAVPAGSSTSKNGIFISAVGVTLTNDIVSLSDPASTATGIGILNNSGTNTLNHVVVVTKAANPGVFLLGTAQTNATGLAVSQTNVGSTAYGLYISGASAHVSGALLRLPAASAADAIAMSTGSLTLDSSLLEGGKIGVQLAETGPASATALIRRSTIDAGTAGLDDGPAASSVNAFTDTDPAAVSAATVVDSLVVDQPSGRNKGGVGTATVTCQNSIVPQHPFNANVVCDGGGGNRAGDPAAIFTNAAAFDYTLKPGSPAIDAGAPAGLSPGEPAIDFGGNPRSVDGDFNCVVRPDLGAYELQGQANTAPTATAAGPGAGTQGDVLSFTAGGTDAEDPGGALTYAWVFSGGGTGTGPSVQHAFAVSGPQTATVTVSDTHGCAATAHVAVAVAPVAAKDTTPPSITKVSVKGRRLRLTLSEAAGVKATVARRVCRTVKGRRRCAYRTVKRVALSGKAGANSARLPSKAKLAGGRYRISITATDAAGNRSKVKRVTVRVR